MLAPAKAVTVRLRIFAPWILRVGKRNMSGLCVKTMRIDSFPVFFTCTSKYIFSFYRCYLPFFLDFFGGVCIVIKHNRAKRRFPTVKNKVQK